MIRTMAVAVVMAGMLTGVRVYAQQANTQSTVPEQFHDDLFAGTEQFAKNAVSATEVTMDPQTLGLVDGRDRDKARRTKLSVVRTFSYDKPGMYDMAAVESYRNKLEGDDWHCSVRTRDLKTGASTDVCYKTRTDGLVESAIMTVSPKQLTFIHTIKVKSAGGGPWPSGPGPNGWDTESDLGAMEAIGPEVQAAMAVEQAEIAASLAEVRAGTEPHVHVDLRGLRLQERNSLPVPPAAPAAPALP